MWTKDEIKDKAEQMVGTLNVEVKGVAERVSITIHKKSGEARRKTGAVLVKAGKALAGRP